MRADTVRLGGFRNWTVRAVALALLVGALAPGAYAQRELKVIPDPDPELERQSFQLGDGLEVNLYAADPLLAKPIHINFDAQGRLWVASSEVYPHVKPGQPADDKILVLEDADADGRAEKTTIFARGLLIPTGVVPGDGGAYVANSTELLFLKDTDGDGHADSRRVMLSGFGTEDTHHIIHTFRWGPDGMMYFNQSIYIHSHIETPHGVRRLNSGGIWQFRPETMQLEVFARGLCNPWGHVFDRWGQSFATDGAGGEGINYVFPGATMFTYAGATKILKGLNPGSPKHCGLEVISGSHFPDDWQGSLVTNDFRAHRVCRFVLSDSGAGYVSREQSEIIKTKHAAFRPVDVKLGPDGALYIADWYNPIIQHGEVDFRDERRDHTHGRIWRVTFKGRSLVDRPKIVGATIDQLLDDLRAPDEFSRVHAKLELKSRGGEAVDPLARWTRSLDSADPQFEHLRLEALWAYQSLDVVEPKLLATLLRSPDHHVRAAATRVLAAWHRRIPQAATLLAVQVDDEHPQVRLEAVRALAELRTAHAAEVAMRALDRPVDPFLDHALWLTARDLQPYWLPALEKGQITFDGNVQHLTYVLQAAGSPGVVGPLMTLLKSGKLPADRSQGILLLVAALGGPSELRVIFDMALDGGKPIAERTALLQALSHATEMRKVKPEGDLNALAPLIEQSDEALRIAAMQAAGQWRLAAVAARLFELGANPQSSTPLRRAALDALAALGPEHAGQLAELAKTGQPFALRTTAIAALASVDVKSAAAEAVGVLADASSQHDPASMLLALLDRQGGSAALVDALANRKLPADAAKLAVRAVRSAAREEAALVAALNVAGGIQAGVQKLTAEQLGQLVADVVAHGDPQRGEAIFRRAEQSCLKCHSIAGAGGRVGPDLVSIGASAQVDYLVESILQPNAKVKENYHGVTVVVDGRITSGVKVRETEQELVLRDVEDRDVALPLADIEDKKEGGSLMPVGLADNLTRAELVDLVRFLSELGKVGPYSVSKSRVARRWLAWQPASNKLASAASPETDDDASDWKSVYSRVSGSLPVGDVPAITADDAASPRVLRCQVDVATGGKAAIVLAGPVQKLWLDGTQLGPAGKLEVDLPAGLHNLTLQLGAQLNDEVRLELVDVPGSPAQVQLVGGK